MKYQINGDGEQLSSFPSTELLEINHKQNPVSSINQTNPSNIGLTKVEYINSSSLLTSPSGLIRVYYYKYYEYF